MIRAHRLRCESAPFHALRNGEKRHEVRRCDDRDFRVGDLLILEEVESSGAYTGEQSLLEVTHITPAGHYGLPDDVCVMSVIPIVSLPLMTRLAK